ncbi:MAG TPA: flagellar basal body L-ring protein FlgH [Alphaproteobacteria bacterium]|jgi:flagellar L-ring protein precursor FlgH
MRGRTVLTSFRIVGVIVAAASLGACNIFTRLSEIGETPPLTNIQNPTHAPTYRPVSMPMPMPRPAIREANALWRPGARAFFRDQRAADVGDIITITITINDKAKVNNETKRSRNNTENLGVSAFLGYEASFNRILPNAINPSNLIDSSAQMDSTGTGSIARDETIEMKIAGIVTQLLPNGNMVIHGRQEVRVNHEVRELQISGVIRPEDIGSDNIITFDKIAEARVAYGGRGLITDVQQPRLGSQVMDILLPF